MDLDSKCFVENDWYQLLVDRAAAEVPFPLMDAVEDPVVVVVAVVVQQQRPQPLQIESIAAVGEASD